MDNNSSFPSKGSTGFRNSTQIKPDSGVEGSSQSDANGRRTRFDDIQTKKSDVSVTNTGPNYATRPSIARVKYSAAGSGSANYDQPDSSALSKKQSMVRRVSTLVGTGGREYKPPPVKKSSHQEGEMGFASRKSVVGENRIQQAITQAQRQTVTRVPLPKTERKSLTQDEAIDPEQEKLWQEHKERLFLQSTIPDQDTAINLFQHGVPCCKTSLSKDGVMAVCAIKKEDPTKNLNLDPDSGISTENLNRPKSISFARGDKEITSTQYPIKDEKYGADSKGCPSSSCKDKNRPTWVDGHENVDELQPETTTHAVVDHEDTKKTDSEPSHKTTQGHSNYSVRKASDSSQSSGVVSSPGPTTAENTPIKTESGSSKHSNTGNRESMRGDGSKSKSSQFRSQISDNKEKEKENDKDKKEEKEKKAKEEKEKREKKAKEEKEKREKKAKEEKDKKDTEEKKKQEKEKKEKKDLEEKEMKEIEKEKKEQK